MAIERQSGAKPTGPLTPDANLQRTRNTLQETLVELKKTTWPTRQEANRLTAVVIGVIVVLGIYMGLLDAGLSFLVNYFKLIH